MAETEVKMGALEWLGVKGTNILRAIGKRAWVPGLALGLFGGVLGGGLLLDPFKNITGVGDFTNNLRNAVKGLPIFDQFSMRFLDTATGNVVTETLGRGLAGPVLSNALAYGAAGVGIGGLSKLLSERRMKAKVAT